MKQLSILSPAETLLVLQDKNASLKELLKLTFMDLLLKQVIRTNDVQRQPSIKDPIRVYKYVETGKNFKTYQPLLHENAFLAPFQKNDDVQILFRHMIKMGYQNAISNNHYHNIIIQNPNMDKCFSQNIFQSIFGGFKLTNGGLELRNKVQTEIDQLETHISSSFENHHQIALKLLKAIKGNIFLLSNIDFDLLNQIDQELLAEMNRKNNNNYDLGCSGCTWNSFDDYSESFDSSCSGDSGCSNSGCGGGDGGCSGCGGCGGD